MPSRGEETAPIFDHTRPCFPRYFKQLEALFNRCQVTSDVEKKDFTTSYLTGYVAEAWEALPEFTSPNSTYEHLRDRLSDIYNFSVLRYTLPNLAELISHHQLAGFQSLQDLNQVPPQVQQIFDTPPRPRPPLTTLMCTLNFSVCNWSVHNSFSPQTLIQSGIGNYLQVR